MVSKFRIKNFRSIVDLTLDFAYGEGKAPNGYRKMISLPFLESPAPWKERLVPSLAFFGANASGKSNVLRAFEVLWDFAIGGDIPHVYAPNALHPEIKETLLEITFFADIHKFLYRIEFIHEEIFIESLICDDVELYRIDRGKGRFPNIATADYSQERLQKVVDVECCNEKGKHIKTFLCKISDNYRGLDVRVAKAILWFLNIYFAPPPPARGEHLINNFLRKREMLNSKLDEMAVVLRKLDIDIESLSFDTILGGEKRLFAHHTNIAGASVKFDFKEESQGTITALMLVMTMLLALETGGVLVVDEIDASLHPLLLQEIVRMLKSRRHNKKNTQIIFTTHTTDILDDSILRVSDIALVRKTLKSGTMVSRLVDMRNPEGRDIRNVTNFRRQYLNGFYSAIPHPAI